MARIVFTTLLVLCIMACLTQHSQAVAFIQKLLTFDNCGKELSISHLAITRSAAIYVIVSRA